MIKVLSCRRSCIGIVAAIATLGLSYTSGSRVLAASSGDPCQETLSVAAAPERTSLSIASKEHPYRQSHESDELSAQHIFEEGQKLRTLYQEASNREAIAKFETAASLWKSAGNKTLAAAALRNKAEVLTMLADFANADSTLETALTLAESAGDKQGMAEVLNCLANNYAMLNRIPESLTFSSRALAISRDSGYRRSEAGALLEAGLAYVVSRDDPKSIGLFQEAIRIFAEIGDRRGQALAATYLGVAYLDTGDAKSALSCEMDRALPLWKELNDKWGEALATNKAALALTNQGESQKALELQRQAREIFRTIGDSRGELVCLNSIGYLRVLINDLDDALELYRETADLLAKKGDNGLEAVALARIGRIHELRHEYAEALDFYSRSNEMFPKEGNEQARMYLWMWTGNIYLQDDRNKALACYEKAAEIAKNIELTKNIKNPRAQAEMLDGFGTVYYQMGNNERALESFQKALVLRRQVKDRQGESLTLYNIARVERDKGDLRDALEHVKQALDITESLRKNLLSPELRASYFASVRKRYELYTDILMRSRDAIGPEDLTAAAFESSEKSRGRSLVEILAESRVDIKTGVDPKLIEREQTLQDQIDGNEENRVKDLASGEKEKAQGIEKKLAELNTEYEALKDQIKLASPKYAALTHPEPVSLREVQKQVLDPDTVLLEYLLGDDRSYMWAVSQSDIKAYALPPKKVIESLANPVLSLLRQTQPSRAQVQEYWAKAGKLSEVLVAPAGDMLNKPRVAVVADGILQYVPFGALPAPRAGTPPNQTEPLPMVVDHEVVDLPSASTLAVLREEFADRQAAPKTAAVFANPVFDKEDPRLRSLRASQDKTLQGRQKRVPRESQKPEDDKTKAPRELRFRPLPATQDEAEAIEGLVTDPSSRWIALGVAATRDAAMSPSLADYRYLHFATHGVMDSVRPDRSCVVLSMVDEHGSARDGFLTLRDIYNLNLSADLVVLSACNTALGKEVDGEGLIGLTRGFMYAGVPRVIASLWKVDDIAASELMRLFYEKLLKEHLRPSAALRAAQVEMWKHTPWKSPSYWGAFVLQGEWK